MNQHIIILAIQRAIGADLTRASTAAPLQCLRGNERTIAEHLAATPMIARFSRADHNPDESLNGTIRKYETALQSCRTIDDIFQHVL